MLVQVDDLQFGNPSEREKLLITKKSVVTPLYDKFKDRKPNPNTSEDTKTELEHLKVYVKDILFEENAQLLSTYKTLSKYPMQSIAKFIKDKGIYAEETINSLIDDLQPLIMKLKYLHNRPRPFQLANALKFKFFPVTNDNIQTPSFPSGSIICAVVILNTISNIHTDIYNEAHELLDNMINAKLYMGHNYSSDIDFALDIADVILNNKEFNKKYKT